MRRSLILGLMLLAPVAGRGAEPTQQGAAELMNSFHQWVDHLLGEHVQELPLRAEPEGDHYRVTVPIPGVQSDHPPELSAAVQQQPDGSWTVTDMRAPLRSEVTANGIKSVTTIEREAAHGIIDPSLKSESRMEAEAAGIRVVTSKPPQAQERRIDLVRTNSRLTPARDGRVDLTMESAFQGANTGAIVTSGLAVGSGVERSHSTVTLRGIDPDKVAPAVQSFVALALASEGPAESGGRRALTPEGRHALLRLIDATDGLLQAAEFFGSADGMQFEIAGFGRASLGHSEMGWGGDLAGGMLRAWSDMLFDHLTVPGLPEGISVLVPQHVRLRLSLSGLPLGPLTKLARAAADERGKEERDAAVEALFAAGSVSAGIESIAFNIGQTEVAGSGNVHWLSPDRAEGELRLTATGFDALMDQTQANPALGQALPFLALARGLAKPEGGALVWEVKATPDGDILVNGRRFDLGPGLPALPQKQG